jgi:hypothetical protein
LDYSTDRRPEPVVNLLALAGLLCLAGFVWLWPPGGLLLLGLVLLVASAARDGRRDRRRR